MISDDAYLYKLKTSGWSNLKVAQRMGVTVEEVQDRWDRIKNLSKTEPLSGADDIRGVVGITVQQFHLLGQSISLLGDAINNGIEPSELKGVIASCPEGEDLVTHLLKHLIILKPFILPSAEELIKEAETK